MSKINKDKLIDFKCETTCQDERNEIKRLALLIKYNASVLDTPYKCKHLYFDSNSGCLPNLTWNSSDTAEGLRHHKGKQLTPQEAIAMLKRACGETEPQAGLKRKRVKTLRQYDRDGKIFRKGYIGYDTIEAHEDLRKNWESVIDSRLEEIAKIKQSITEVKKAIRQNEAERKLYDQDEAEGWIEQR